MNAATERTMTAEEYHAAPGLSNSGMKDLAVSPYRYWFKHVNPDRVEEEPSKYMRIGSAVHCAVLETAAFESRYACEFIPPDECLDTIDEMRLFLADMQIKPKGTRKADIIAQVRGAVPSKPIKAVLEAEHTKQHEGKEILRFDDWRSVTGAAQALLAEPEVKAILREGEPEVPLFANDPETGVPLKCKLDWRHPALTFDIKTFSNSRGKPIDKAVGDAVLYEGYSRQACLYTKIRELVDGKSFKFVYALVENEPPHEVRLRCLQEKLSGMGQLYWGKAAAEVQGCIAIYRECVAKYGEKPWRDAAEIKPLLDKEMEALLYI